MKNERTFLAIAGILLILVIAISCSKDDKDPRPDLPPEAALSMDFTDFTSFPDTTDLKSNAYYTNFANAFANVFAWNVVTAFVMVVPVAAYAECLQSTPEYINGAWQWTASATLLSVTYEARLVADRVDNETYSAKMFISQTGGVQDFLWFEGILRYDRTHAEWTMYRSPAVNVEWLSVVWNKDWVADTSDITYSIIETGNNEFGSYIKYGLTDDAGFDAFYTISGSQSSIEIEMNTATKAGRIRSQAIFGDPEWHCWDENLMNIACN